jgi:L-threonylcarbamoyladenylate synthase
MKTISVSDKKVVNLAVDVLSTSGVLVYPTDTVYGLGADATNAKAVSKVRTIKSRESDKPILVMVSDIEMLEKYAFVTDVAKKLVKKFLPGPLSIVLRGRGEFLSEVQNKDGSIGFRMPQNTFCLELVKKFGKPITSTSVNISGMRQATKLSCMLHQINDGLDKLDLVVDAGVLKEKRASTIVDARFENLKVLREGSISANLF